MVVQDVFEEFDSNEEQAVINLRGKVEPVSRDLMNDERNGSISRI